MAVVDDVGLLSGGFQEGMDDVPGDDLTSVDVVICAYDMRRWSWLQEAVDSVLGQRYAPRSCIVVIDHNDALLARALDELRHTGVVILPNDSTPGLAGARNTGLSASAAEVVAFLDDDARASRDWLESLVAPYADPSVVGTGGRILAHWEAGRPRWFPGEYGWVVGCEYTGLPEAQAPIRNAIGANMSFRRGALVAAGGFSSSVGRTSRRSLGCEETEASIRVRARTGGQIVYAPAASVTHHVPPERGTLRYFFRRCYNEGISKAVVVGLAGAGAGLSSERTYITKTLTRAVLRCIRNGARGNWASVGEGVAIVGGCLITCFGYGIGRVAAAIRG